MFVNVKELRPAGERLLARFAQVVAKRVANESARRWYVVRARQYLQAHAELPFEEHTPEHVSRYLAAVGHEVRLTDWQFRQIVDALELLCKTAAVPWVAQVDWHYWRASASDLGASHPTLAREQALSQTRPSAQIRRVRRAWRQSRNATLTPSNA